MNLKQFSDRQLLEAIYLLLCQQQVKIAEIDNDEKQITMNVIADLVGTKIVEVQDGVQFRTNGIRKGI